MRAGEKCFVKFESWGLEYLYCVRGGELTTFIHFTHHGTVRLNFTDPIECVRHFEREVAKQIADLANPHLWAMQSENPRPYRIDDPLR
jgi:hypothetical protein